MYSFFYKVLIWEAIFGLFLPWSSPMPVPAKGPLPVYAVEKLSGQINTCYDEINPVVSLDGKTMYFTRVGHPSFDKTLKVDHEDYAETLDFHAYAAALKDVYLQLGESEANDPVSSPFNQDIWIANSQYGTFDQIIHPGYPLNSALPNSVCAVTTDPNTIVIVNQFYKDGSMQKGFSFAKKSAWEDWRFPEPLYIYDYYNLEPGVNLTLSRDNEVMILSMNRNDSQGGNDLYVSFRVHTTLWSAPLHLGPVINSGKNEITPFLSDDKRLLFFSGPAGQFDNQDIYVAERLDDSWTQWSTPRALPQPINSAGDEAQPFLNQRTGFLYFTSTRDGSSDIFRVNYKEPAARPVPVFATTRPDTQVKCLIRDSQSGKSISGTLLWGYADEVEFSHSAAIEPGGILLPTDETDRILKIKAALPGYITREIRLDMANVLMKAKGVVTIDVPADPILVGANISLAPIYFMQGKDQILSGSYAELNRLYDVLKANPSLQIRIEGHTDNVGDAFALFELSQKRAVAIKQYLVKAGIQSFRIKTKGFGPKQPLNDNSTETLRQANRRVEVVITQV